MADISITGYGSYEIESQTEEGATWMWSNISEAESVGGGMLVARIDNTLDMRDVLDDASEEGLEIEVNGEPYEE